MLPRERRGCVQTPRRMPQSADPVQTRLFEVPTDGRVAQLPRRRFEHQSADILNRVSGYDCL